VRELKNAADRRNPYDKKKRRGEWLGWKDSNLRMAGSKPAIPSICISNLLIHMEPAIPSNTPESPLLPPELPLAQYQLTTEGRAAVPTMPQMVHGPRLQSPRVCNRSSIPKPSCSRHVSELGSALALRFIKSVVTLSREFRRMLISWLAQLVYSALPTPAEWGDKS